MLLANVVVCTTTQVASGLFRAKFFDVVINDETSVTTLCEILLAWRRHETLILIGDDEQLGPTVLTAKDKNPMYRTLKDSAFARWRDIYMPAFRLDEQMRMPVGMAHPSNEVIYKGMLKDGPGTSLEEVPLAALFRAYTREMFPNTLIEPDGHVYPVCSNWTEMRAIFARLYSIMYIYIYIYITVCSPTAQTSTVSVE